MQSYYTILYKFIRIFFIVFIFTLLFDLIFTNFVKIVLPYNFLDMLNNSKANTRNFKQNINSSYYSEINGKIKFCTDKYGLRIKCKSKKKNNNFDFLIMGNIFTEGKHLNHSDSFFGMIELSNPNLNFANFGVSSMQIEDYYNLVNQIIYNNEFKFDHLVIYLDQSNFQIGKDDNKALDIKKNGSKIKFFIRNNFYIYLKLYKFLLFNFNKEKLWAYSPSNHYNHWNENNLNTIKEIHKKKINILNDIYFLLNSVNKKFSIGIYPYPYDFLYNNKKSNFVKLINDFCYLKCYNYFNSFPIFYQHLNKNNQWELIEKYFLKYSVHHNKKGNLLIMQNFNKTIH